MLQEFLKRWYILLSVLYIFNCFIKFIVNLSKSALDIYIVAQTDNYGKTNMETYALKNFLKLTNKPNA